VPRADGVIVDAAWLGSHQVFAGSGDVATLTFRVKKRNARPELETAELRDVNNGVLGAEAPDDLADGDIESPSGTPDTAQLPGVTRLIGAQPNPFTGRTDIRFSLSQAQEVSVQIFDINGRLVRTLIEGSLPAGEHTVPWDGRGSGGHKVSAGVYFYSFQADGRQESRKLFMAR
jgi:hypothetical protein